MKPTLKENSKEHPLDPRLAAIVNEFKGKPGATIPLLQRIEAEFGYISEENLAPAARITGIPLSQLYGVVTFYAQFHLSPHGRHQVRVCRGTACHVKGGKDVLRSAQKRLGVDEGTTGDMKYSLETVACLGTCALAPVMVVNGDYYGNLTSKKAKTLLEGVDGED